MNVHKAFWDDKNMVINKMHSSAPKQHWQFQAGLTTV